MNGTVPPTVEPEPSTEYTQIGTDNDVLANGFIHLISKTHDVSLVEEHIPSIKHLAADLEEAIKAVWPRRQGIRYTQAHALLIRFEDDDLGVLSEIQELKHVFQDIYSYNVETYDIPNARPQRALNQRIQEFLKYDEMNGNETLLIVYYDGHARRVHDSNEPPIWFANRKLTSPAAPCAGIQSLPEESEADVLLLYDCCHSAPTRTNRCPQSRKSVTEAISACGYETIAPEVDEHSFSRALIQTLAAASQGHPFSIGELHSWILGRLKFWLPSLAQNDDGNFLRNADGRFAYERQPRRTPIYSILCETEPRRSIVLAPLRTSTLDATSLTSGHHNVNSTTSTSIGNKDSLFGSRNPFRKPGDSNAGNEEYPQILLSIRLEKTELDIQVWRDWLRNLPAEGQDIKIEGIYRSFSTLMLLRMPVATWDLLRENPAYSFVGFVTSNNMVSTLSAGPLFQGENPKISATGFSRTVSVDSQGSKLEVVLKSGSSKHSVNNEISFSEENTTGTLRVATSSETFSHDGRRRGSASSGGTVQAWDGDTNTTISTNEHKTMSPSELEKEIADLEELDQHLRNRSSSIPESGPFRVHRSNMNVRISGIKGQFSLIHIPLHLYAAFFQPILQVLLPQEGLSHLSEFEDILEGFSIDGKHGFLNISVTPLECSIVCHTTWVQNVFARVIALLPKESSKQIQISKDAYNVFAVISAGIEEGKRVMDVTAPLAIAGVPIFFIPTYCTDFILAPSKDRHTVAQVLLAYGFEFSENDSVYLTPSTLHSKLRSAGIDAPLTPPPSDVAGLQSRAFSQLKKGRMNPFTEPSLHLVQCSGKKMTYEDDSLQFPIPIDTIDSKLYIGLISALAQQPRFLSVTLSSVDAPSLLIDKYLLGLFGDSIAGGTETDLVPIFFDLHDLPLESSGIVCGVPSKLVDEMRRHDRAANPDWELTYLSTARAGAVILSAEALAMALDVLMPLF